MRTHLLALSLLTIIGAPTMASSGHRSAAALDPKMDVETNKDQIAGFFLINNTGATNSALVGQVNASDPDAAGVYGLALGAGGHGGLFIAGIGSTGAALKA